MKEMCNKKVLLSVSCKSSVKINQRFLLYCKRVQRFCLHIHNHLTMVTLEELASGGIADNGPWIVTTLWNSNVTMSFTSLLNISSLLGINHSLRAPTLCNCFKCKWLPSVVFVMFILFLMNLTVPVLTQGLRKPCYLPLVFFVFQYMQIV